MTGHYFCYSIIFKVKLAFLSDKDEIITVTLQANLLLNILLPNDIATY